MFAYGGIGIVVCGMQGGHDKKSTLPDAPWDPFIPQNTQNESYPAHKKFEKNNNNHNNSHIALFDACFDDSKCIFQVSPAYFPDLNVVHLPRTKYPYHPGPITRPQPHGTRNICRMTTDLPNPGVTPKT